MLKNHAFFIQGDSFLLPEGASPAAGEIPLNLADDFPGSDIFTIPPVSGGLSAGVHGDPITCVSVPPDFPLPPGWQSIPGRRFLPLPEEFVPEADGVSRPFAVDGTGAAGKLFRALHITQWRRDSRYCGTCGSPNTDAPGELARLCPACGRMEFPRIAPAVITIITNNEGKALLAHNKKFAPGVYSLIAGFAEAGESLEATVAREAREETGIEISDIRYIVSQPWPFPHSLMTGFTAKYKSGAITPDGVEIEDARWFTPEELPKLPGPGSVSLYLINLWLDGKLTG